jgi:hypothetical protein
LLLLLLLLLLMMMMIMLMMILLVVACITHCQYEIACAPLFLGRRPFAKILQLGAEPIGLDSLCLNGVEYTIPHVSIEAMRIIK